MVCTVLDLTAMSFGLALRFKLYIVPIFLKKFVRKIIDAIFKSTVKAISLIIYDKQSYNSLYSNFTLSV
jgi:hypothetical protein